MLPVQDQRVVFVGGKGGVGKTTTAAAMALALAESAERTLLVSTDPAHSLSDLFDRRIGDEEVEIVEGLEALEIDPEGEMDRYLKEVTRNLRELVRPEMYPDIEKQIELARSSPGAQEAALLDRMSRILIEAPEHYDRIVFDTAPTGSTLRLLSLPEVMTAWMEGLLERRDRSESFRESLRGMGWSERDVEGDADSEAAPSEDARARRIREVLTRRRRRFLRTRRILQDPDRCAFVLVVLAEKLPILEGHRAYETLLRAKIPVVALIVNRLLPGGELGDFLEQRRRQEAEYLAEIDRLFGDLPQIRIPLLEEDVGGLEGLRAVVGHLSGAKEARA